MSGLYDSYQRPINYLRISVTDRCNLRCIYCMPPEGIQNFPHSRILTYEEIFLVAQAAAEIGINKIRLTGGEPLVRLNFVNLVRMLAKIKGIDDISMTTNGTLLSRYATELKQAGLKRVNVSLDSLKEEKFQQITRLGKLKDVLKGIESAHRAGLHPVKINMVVMRGINDDEILDFALKTLREEWHVRFIELMPFIRGEKKWFISALEIFSFLTEKIGKLEPTPSNGNGPAKYFRLPNARGTIGFIAPVTEHICVNCNRIRLTAEGGLRPCLLSDKEIELRETLRQGASFEDLKLLLRKAVALKPEHKTFPPGRAMAQIGG